MGNQFNAGVLSQSASSNHALLITKSALLIKKKMPSVSANQHWVILINKTNKHIFRLQWVLHKRETREYIERTSENKLKPRKIK